MADDSIRTLTIQLGYLVDDASRSRFDAAAIKSTALGVALGETLVGAAKEAGTYFVKLAENMEQLYFASKRTGSSAAEITDLSLSLQNAGASAAGVQTTIENIGKFAQDTFGGKSILMGLGVKPEDVNNSVKAFHEIVAAGKKTFGDTDFGWTEFINRVSSIPNLNLDRNALYAEWHPDKDAPETDAQIAERMGINWEKAATEAHKFNDEARILAVEFKSELVPYLEKFYGFAVGAEKAFQDIIDGITGKPLSEALEKLGIGKGTADVLASPATVLNDWNDLVNNPSAAAMHKAVADSNAAVGGAISGVGKWVAGGITNGAYASNPKAQQAIRYFMSSAGGGYSQDEAIGLTSNFIDESGLDPNARGDKVKNGNYTAFGIAQWHMKRVKEILAATGIDVRTASYEDQLKAVTWELHNTENAADIHLRGADKAGEAAFNVSKYYERPLLGDVTAARRALTAQGLATAINNNITIQVTVAPGSDGKAQGKAAGDAFNTTVHNMSGVQ